MTVRKVGEQEGVGCVLQGQKTDGNRTRRTKIPSSVLDEVATGDAGLTVVLAGALNAGAAAGVIGLNLRGKTPLE